MEKNFWTEENKIMNYDSLIRADMQRKVMKLDGQVVTGGDIVDRLYNYDYFIGNKEKAIQFIADYADEFVEALNKYHQRTGKLFPQLTNPLKVSTLMTLYKGKEIAKKCESLRKKWEEKIIVNTNSLDILLQELEGPELSEQTRLSEKLFTTKETLDQVCTDYLCKELDASVDDNITLYEGVKHLQMPNLSEKTIHSILKNSYEDVARVALDKNVNTKNINVFMRDVVFARSNEIAEKEFHLENRNIPLNKETIKAIRGIFKNKISHEVEFRPMMEDKQHTKEIQREK